MPQLTALKPSPQELGALISGSAKDRYTYFIKRVADFEEAWGLYDEGWAMVGDEHGRTAIVLWPAKDYADFARADDWKHFEAKSISIDRLINVMLPEMAKNGTLVAVFMVMQRDDNPMVNAHDLLLDLKNELKNYE